MDFMTFAYLQLGQDKNALELVEERNRVTKLVADRVSVGIMLSIIPARYAIERQDWRQAAALEPRGPIGDKYPQAEAITWFTRGIGAARTGDLDRARASAVKLGSLKAALEQSNQVFWVAQAQMQIDAVNAWVALAENRNEDALRLMRSAVETRIPIFGLLRARATLVLGFDEMVLTKWALSAFLGTLPPTPVVYSVPGTALHSGLRCAGSQSCGSQREQFAQWMMAGEHQANATGVA